MNDPTKNVVLDLAKHTQLVARVFAGDEWGRQTRRQAGLARYDKDPNTTVSIVLPMDTLCLSSSFIRGMLGPSVRALGSKCLSKFRIVAGTEKTEYFNQVIRTEILELLAAPSEFRRASRHPESAEDKRMSDNHISSWY
jgi:hypothetical protein